MPTFSKADALGTLVGKVLDPEIDLSPAGIDNHAMGTVFEELVRKFCVVQIMICGATPARLVKAAFANASLAYMVCFPFCRNDTIHATL